MEQREANADAKAMQLIDEFSSKFRNITYTVHPSNIPGESAGKGSNVAWAARKLSERYPIEQRKDVVVTGIDGMFIENPEPKEMAIPACSCRVFCESRRDGCGYHLVSICMHAE